jgi:hypothetical protein
VNRVAADVLRVRTGCDRLGQNVTAPLVVGMPRYTGDRSRRPRSVEDRPPTPPGPCADRNKTWYRESLPTLHSSCANSPCHLFDGLRMVIPAVVTNSIDTPAAVHPAITPARSSLVRFRVRNVRYRSALSFALRQSLAPGGTSDTDVSYCSVLHNSLPFLTQSTRRRYRMKLASRHPALLLFKPR